MSARLAGKVALITGAARGQGRSHAVRLAAEGADVIAVDICRDLDSVGYPLATEADLAETVSQVEALDRRIVAATADVRDAAALGAAVAEGVERLGGVDIVLANAGIGLSAPEVEAERAFRDMLEVNLIGVFNTVHAAAVAHRCGWASASAFIDVFRDAFGHTPGSAPSGLSRSSAGPHR